MEINSSLALLIDPPKGQYMLERWHLESMEIIATGRLKLGKSPMTVKPVLLDRYKSK